ncbi:hypothetical protein GUJ93_ZPchr0010g10612 [Zizania palustris]|uniref:Uncharacterized protein n=1 Tax=Zizania palustris TaxID=103762 RepID=A0A8J5W8G7_ZIZPA|nr:hypothetical protein GUJ93_ZPchr0010g10612 [Zizania palustris]
MANGSAAVRMNQETSTLTCCAKCRRHTRSTAATSGAPGRTRKKQDARCKFHLPGETAAAEGSRCARAVKRKGWPAASRETRREYREERRKLRYEGNGGRANTGPPPRAPCLGPPRTVPCVAVRRASARRRSHAPRPAVARPRIGPPPLHAPRVAATRRKWRPPRAPARALLRTLGMP